MRKALVVLLFGIVLMLGSCVPYGVIAWRSFNADIAHQQAVSVGQTLVTEAIAVNPGNYIQPALKLTVHTEVVETRERFDTHEHKPRYQFPLQYAVLDSAGGILFEDTLVIDSSGTRHNVHRWTGTDGARVRYEKVLSKLKPPEDGEVRVRLRIEADDIYGARLESVRLLVYDDVYKHGALFMLGFGMGILGVLALIGGTIGALVSGAAATAVTPSPPVSTPSPKPAATPGAQRYAGFLHLAGLLSHLIPLGGLIAQLVMWLVKKDEDGFINAHGMSAVNFRLSMLIYKLIAVVLIFTILFLPLALLALVVLAVIDIIFVIIAAMAAFEGRPYSYPLAIRFLG